jgi:hypothetical protein
MTPRACKICRNFQPGERLPASEILWNTGTGQCRRYPPRLVFVETTPYSVWPRTGEDDWCGEFHFQTADDPTIPVLRGVGGNPHKEP